MAELKVYYPLGTVFTTGEQERSLMIVGYNVTDAATGKVYDYAATAYPEGYGGKFLAMLNDRDIYEVLCLGYQDAEVILHQKDVVEGRALLDMPVSEFAEMFADSDPEQLLRGTTEINRIYNPSETEA